jgi:hypothetical protein
MSNVKEVVLRQTVRIEGWVLSELVSEYGKDLSALTDEEVEVFAKFYAESHSVVDDNYESVVITRR